MIDWDQMKTAVQLADEARRASVPAEISRAQGTRLLKKMGLWDAVETMYAAMEPGDDKDDAHAGLYDTNIWRRQSPFLVRMAAMLGLTEVDLVGIFIEAAKIEV